MALSSVLMYTSVRMVVQRALVLSLLSLQMMPVTLSSSSTVTIGKAAHSRCVKTATLEHQVDLGAEVGLELVVVLAEALEPVAVLALEVDSAVDSVVDAEASEVVSKDHRTVVLTLLFHLPRQTRSPILQRLEQREVRQFTSEM